MGARDSHARNKGGVDAVASFLPPLSSASADASVSARSFLARKWLTIVGTTAAALLLVLVPALRVTKTGADCDRRNTVQANYVPARPAALESLSTCAPCPTCISCPTCVAASSCPTCAACDCPKHPQRTAYEARLGDGGVPLTGGSSSGGGLNDGGVGKYGYTHPGGEYPRHDAFTHPRDALQQLRARDATERPRNTSDFPLLLCVGQGKTATKSLNKALVMLGFQTAHFYGCVTQYSNAQCPCHSRNADFQRAKCAPCDAPAVAVLASTGFCTIMLRR